MLDILNNKKAFTLLELLIALAISGVVMAGIYSAYYSQQKSYITQEQVAAMQQELRAAMYIMQREIRMAGCDPIGSAGAGIQTANANAITFTLDITGGESDGKDNDTDGSVDEADENRFSDGSCDDTNENITYSLYTANGIQKLGRDTGGGNQPVAENIDALDFVYLDEDNNILDDDGSGNVTTSIASVRSVQITMVARTGKRDPGYTNHTSYKNQQDTTIYIALNDNFRRKLSTAEVECRNLGL
jgi:type IV pilus assembly protein PilW